MEKIRTFVENMFLSFPDTPETREAKAHILEGMTDRYEALLAQGKNENEAFGIVIGEFGSMEELRQELGLDGNRAEPSPLLTTAPVWEDFPQAEYDAFQKRFSLAIASGVVLCILSGAIWIVLDQVAFIRATQLHDVVSLLMLAAAVGLFVYFGIQKNRYDEMSRMAGGLPPVPKQDKDNPLHGVIMLAATAAYLFMGFVLDLWHPGWIVFIAGAALCCLADIVWKRQ